MNTKPKAVNFVIQKSVLRDPEVIASLSDIYNKYVVVPADKASKNIVFVCKTHYVNCVKSH